MGLEPLFAAWRNRYFDEPTGSGCPFCLMSNSEQFQEDLVVKRFKFCVVSLNLFPYGSGHVLVFPKSHKSNFVSLGQEERLELFEVVSQAISAVEKAYAPDGINFGANLGRAAGAGIPDHLHVHVLPRFGGDTGFITSISNTRVIPEAFEVSRDKLRKSWPS